MHRVFTKSIVRFQKTAGGISIPPAVFIMLSLLYATADSIADLLKWL
jgi:hypothetical protein